MFPGSSRVTAVFVNFQKTLCFGAAAIWPKLCSLSATFWSSLGRGRGENVTEGGVTAELTIRPLVRGDKAEWAELWRGYLTFYETTRPDEIFDMAFERLLGDDKQDYSGLVAEQDGTLVGLAHYLFHRHGWSAKNVCYMQDLYAVPEARGTGVGRELIEGVYAAADAAGCANTYWLTQDFNETTRRLYDRIGTVTPFIKYNRS